MPQGSEATQTLESSATTHTLTIEGRSVGAQGVEVIGSFVTSKKVNAAAAARITGATVTAAGSIVALSKIDVGNSIHVLVSVRNSTAGALLTVALVLYDAAGAVVGITRDYTFAADTSYTDGSKYLCPAEIIDISVASQVGIIVRSVSGTADVYLEAM